jgi:hypothetical protein
MGHISERRTSPRHPYAGIVEVSGVMAVARDISRVGVSFYLRTPLKVGSVLDIAAGGSVTEPAVIRTHAVVARVEPHAKGYLVGVQFPQEVNVGEPSTRSPARRGRERSEIDRSRPKLRRRDFRAPFLSRTLR